MKTIISQDNKIFKLCVQLGQKKYRDRLGLYIAEGEKIVIEALDAGSARTVVIREGAHMDFPMAQKVDSATQRANPMVLETGQFAREDTAFVFMSGSLFSRIAQTETSQGILAIVAKPQMDKQSFLEAISGPKDRVLVLDRLQDPGNIGTIIRTADAAGYAGMIVMKGSGDIFSPKVIRSAAGSLLRLPVYQATDENEVLSMLAETGKTLVGTTPEAGTDYDRADWNLGTALLIGNEGNGLSQTFKAATHINVRIPMNKEVDSLNAAVAAGILIYESIKERETACRIS
jgi:RNA methyltransferase, TrmH family